MIVNALTSDMKVKPRTSKLQVFSFSQVYNAKLGECEVKL